MSRPFSDRLRVVAVINCNSNFLAGTGTGYTLAVESVGHIGNGDATWRGRINSAGEGAVPGRSGMWVNSPPGTLVPNTWTHLALVHDPSETPENNLILYVDGAPYTGTDGRGTDAGVSLGGANKCVDTAAGGDFCDPRQWSNGLRAGPTCGTDAAPCETASCSIGGHPSAAGWASAHGVYFDGLIDEVRIFNHALTPGEISQEAVHYWCDSITDSAPLLHYDFNEGGGNAVHDESPYHNDLDISAAEHLGDAAWTSNGMCNTALEFDSAHPEVSGDCLQTAPIPVGETVTFSMWVYLHDMVPQPIQAFHCKSVSDPHENFVFGTNSDQTAWMTRIWSQELAEQCTPPDGSPDGAPCICGNVPGQPNAGQNCGLNTIEGPTTGPNSVSRNQWVHLAAVYDQTGGSGQDDPRQQYILYINGDPYYNDGFASFMPNRMFGGLACEIGCRIGYNGRQHDFFDGLIDEVRVLERALTAQEIQQEMTMPWCTPLIMHLSFNEGHGHVIHDSSPSRLDVTLADSPWATGTATLAGSPGWATGRDAVCGSAMEMMTDGVGDCFTLDAVPFGEAVTITMWAMLHTDGQSGHGGGGGQLINCHGNGGNDGSHSEALVIETVGDSSSWRLRTWIAGMEAVSPDGSANNAVIAPYMANEWTHLAAVYDPRKDPLRQLVLYVNGVPHFGGASVIWENMLDDGGGFCSVGCHPVGGGQAFFDGLLDELRIYDGALSTGAVRNDFAHMWCQSSPPPPPPGSGLILFYSFDEASGDWVGDSSGNNNDVDLTAELSWTPTTPPEAAWVTPGICGAALEFLTGGTGVISQAICRRL